MLVCPIPFRPHLLLACLPVKLFHCQSATATASSTSFACLFSSIQYIDVTNTHADNHCNTDTISYKCIEAKLQLPLKALSLALSLFLGCFIFDFCSQRVHFHLMSKVVYPSHNIYFIILFNLFFIKMKLKRNVKSCKRILN